MKDEEDNKLHLNLSEQLVYTEMKVSIITVAKNSTNTIERSALDPLIAEIRRRGLVTPAVFFLESVEPLNNVGAQALHFMQPFATAVLDQVHYAVLVKYLERRGSITWVAQELQREPAA